MDWKTALEEARAKRAAPRQQMWEEMRAELHAWAVVENRSTENKLRQNRKSTRTPYEQCVIDAQKFRRKLLRLGRDNYTRGWNKAQFDFVSLGGERRFTGKERGRRLAWNCPHTDREQYGLGLCTACYRLRGRYLKSGKLELPEGHPLKCGHEPHPTLPTIKDECGLCYYRKYLPRYRARQARLKAAREGKPCTFRHRPRRPKVAASSAGKALERSA